MSIPPDPEAFRTSREEAHLPSEPVTVPEAQTLPAENPLLVASGPSWSGETLTSPSAPTGSGRSEGSLFLEAGQRWGRFQILEILGSGGMGRVYKAFDRRLERYTALKFLRSSSNKDRSDLLLQEARAQARIEHPGICAIYSVDQVEGSPFIAMQYIEGSSLRRLARELTLEQKVEVLRQVALGLHAAHRAGLLHRDVKPSNILVESLEGGELQARLVDFGLAADERLFEKDSSLAGTPRYLSPEAVLGLPLDRRTDLYGLGVTFYEMLCDRPPFEGSPTELLQKISTERPAPPSHWQAGLHPDLEAIVLKCMARKPEDRYRTCLELAQDLEAHLAGATVLARMDDWRYRWKHFLKRRWRALLTGFLAFLVLGMGLGGWIYLRWQAAEQAELAHRLGQEVQLLEGRMLLAYLAPSHDIREDRREVREQMNQLEQGLEGLSGLSRGLVLYALGRGHLALSELDPALHHLQSARESGLESTELHQALGLALGRLYQKERQNALQIRDPHQRQERLDKLKEQLRDPALLSLKRVQQASQGGLKRISPSYLEGLISLFEENWDAAIRSARRSRSEAAWFYEGFLLEAEALMESARGDNGSGRSKQALEKFELAHLALQEAARIARSDPRVQETLCQQGRLLMETRLDQGKAREQDFQEATLDCLRALQVDPLSSRAPLSNAGLAFSHALFLQAQNQDPGQALEEVLLNASAATRNGADATGVFTMQTNASLLRAEWKMRQVEDLRGNADLERVFQLTGKRLEQEPEHLVALGNRGMAWLFLANNLFDQGLNPLAELQKAREDFLTALRLIASRNGSVPEPPELYGVSLQGNVSRSYWQLELLGGASLLQAQWELLVGVDSEAMTEDAVQVFQAMVETLPDSLHSLRALGQAYLLAARNPQATPEQHSMALVKARQSLQMALQLQPEESSCLLQLVQIEMESARQASTGEEAAQALQQADIALQQLEKLQVARPEVLLQRSLWQALQAIQSPGDKLRDALQEALLGLEEVQRLRPLWWMARIAQSQILHWQGALLQDENAKARALEILNASSSLWPEIPATVVHGLPGAFQPYPGTEESP